MNALSRMYATVRRTLCCTEPDVWITQIDEHPLLVREIRPAPSTVVQKPPLLIGLHGYGIDEMQIKTLVDIQLDQPFIYIAPRAPYKHPTGGYAWFPIDVIDGALQTNLTKIKISLDLVAKLIPRAIVRYQADPQRVFVLGYSQGATMSIGIMLAYREQIAGAAAISGRLIDDFKLFTNPPNGQRKPFFLGYGTKDNFITPEDMNETRAYMELQSIDITYREYPIPHVVSQEQLRHLEAWIQPLLR